MYLTYTEYTNFGGVLSETEFNRHSYRVEKEIDNATFNRCQDMSDVPENVKRCAFELVEYISRNTKDGALQGVSSFGNDGYSVTYKDPLNAAQQIYSIIYTYLADSGLMYVGV